MHGCGLLDSCEWDVNGRHSVLEGSGVSSTVFLRNMTRLFLSLFCKQKALCITENIKGSPRTEGLLARLELSVLITPGQRRPDKNVPFLPPIHRPQHRGFSNSGDIPSSPTGLYPEIFPASSHHWAVLSCCSAHLPAPVLPPAQSENCSSACSFYCLCIFFPEGSTGAQDNPEELLTQGPVGSLIL